MKHILIILVILTFSSCASLRFKMVSGHYRTKGGFEWGSWIMLNQDSTFTYEWQGGLDGGKTEGNWHIESNKLILNSYLQPKPDSLPDYNIIETNNKNSQNITIDLFWPDSTDVLVGAIGLLFFNADTVDGGISDLNGRIIFKNQPVDSIKIHFIGFKDVVMTDIVNEYYKIAVESELDMYEYFTNEIWIIRSSYLIDRSRNEYYYEKRFYKVE